MVKIRKYGFIKEEKIADRIEVEDIEDDEGERGQINRDEIIVVVKKDAQVIKRIKIKKEEIEERIDKETG